MVTTECKSTLSESSASMECVFKMGQMQEKTFSGLLKTDIVHRHNSSHAFDLT